MTELEQFKKWMKDTKRYLKLIKGVDEIKEALKQRSPARTLGREIRQ